tara:strand:+ start:12481 stop:13338 length:858 start_codon:yes stop_codon:yes gene_type:complete
LERLVHYTSIPFQFRGLDVHVETTGEGPSLFVIHGGPGLSSRYLTPFMLPLAESYKVIAHDQTGCGRSQPLPEGETYTMQREVDLLKELVLWAKENNPNQPVYIMGHSFGAVETMCFLKEHAALVDKVVLLTASPIAKVAEHDPLMGRLAKMDKDLKWDLIQLNKIRRKRPWTHEEQVQAVTLGLSGGLTDLALLPQLHFDYTVDMADQISTEMKAYDLQPAMNQVETPALVLAGRHDFFVVEAQEKTHKAFPNSRLEILEESGHFPFLEQPEAFTQTVRAFLGV